MSEMDAPSIELIGAVNKTLQEDVFSKIHEVCRIQDAPRGKPG